MAYCLWRYKFTCLFVPIATIVCGIDVKGTAFGLFSSNNWQSMSEAWLRQWTIIYELQVHLFGLCLATIVCGINVKGTAFGLWKSDNWRSMSEAWLRQWTIVYEGTSSFVWFVPSNNRMWDRCQGHSIWSVFIQQLVRSFHPTTGMIFSSNNWYDLFIQQVVWFFHPTTGGSFYPTTGMIFSSNNWYDLFIQKLVWSFLPTTGVIFSSNKWCDLFIQKLVWSFLPTTGMSFSFNNWYDLFIQQVVWSFHPKTGMIFSSNSWYDLFNNWRSMSEACSGSELSKCFNAVSFDLGHSFCSYASSWWSASGVWLRQWIQ